MRMKYTLVIDAPKSIQPTDTQIMEAVIELIKQRQTMLNSNSGYRVDMGKDRSE